MVSIIRNEFVFHNYNNSVNTHSSYLKIVRQIKVLAFFNFPWQIIRQTGQIEGQLFRIFTATSSLSCRMTKLKYYLHLLTHIGADANSSYLDIKRICMVNIICILCIIPSFVFSTINIFQERWILSSINLLTGMSYSVVLGLQYFHRPRSAKALLLISSTILFFISGLLYQNGAQYFLLSVLVVSMLLYDNIKYLSIGSGIISCGILIIYSNPDIDFIEAPVHKDRAIYNILSSLVFLITAIAFFKRVIYNDKKQIEEQRIRLEEMNNEKEKIFSIMAHDMRAPLVNASIIIDIFETNTVNKDHMHDFIEQLKRQLKDQHKVLDQILTWSSNSMKGAPTIRTKICVVKALEEIINEFKIHYIRKGIHIHVNVNESSFLFVNYDHMRIILRNLISNAIKFSYQDGHVYISTTEDEQRIYIHIQDEGVGIDMEKSEALFNQVQQRSIGTSNESGAGLGLLLCKELIELNEGTIHIESQPNAGSTFTVGFPKYTAHDSNANMDKEEFFTLQNSES